MWFWIATTYACGGVATDRTGIVCDAAPIYRRRMMGRFLNDCIRELRRDRQLVGWKRLGS